MSPSRSKQVLLLYYSGVLASQLATVVLLLPHYQQMYPYQVPGSYCWVHQYERCIERPDPVAIFHDRAGIEENTKYPLRRRCFLRCKSSTLNFLVFIASSDVCFAAYAIGRKSPSHRLGFNCRLLKYERSTGFIKILTETLILQVWIEVKQEISYFRCR